MAKGEFYKGSYILEKVPRLKQYVPINDKCLVGISKTGNIKYTFNGTQILVASRSSIPADIYNSAHKLLAEEEPPANPIPSGLPKAQISPSQYARLCADMECPRGSIGNYYAKEGHTGLFYQKKKNKKKTTEVAFSASKKFTDEILADIVLRAEGNADYIEEKIGIVQKQKSICFDKQNELDESVHLMSSGYAKLSITSEGPCIYFSISGIGNIHSTSEFPCRLDEELDGDSIKKWFKNRCKAVIKARNKEEREQLAGKAEDSFIHELRMLFKQNGLNIKICEFKKENKKDILFVQGSVCTNELVSTSIEYSFIAKDEWFSQISGDNGIIHYNLSKAGEKQIEKEAKSVYKMLLAKDWIYDEKGSRPGAIKTEYRKYANHFTNGITTLCCSPYKLNMLTTLHVMYNVKTGTFSYDTPIVFIKEDSTRQLKAKKKPVYNETVKETSSEKYKKANDFFSERKTELENNHQISMHFQKGDGTLYGKTEILIISGNIRTVYNWNCPSYKDSLPEWKKKAKSNIREIITQKEEARERQKQENIRKLGEFAGSFIATDVAKFIETNENYITQNAAVHYLRGLKETFGGIIRDTGCEGKYNRASSEYVDGIINKMVMAGYLYRKQLKGTYGYFDILKTNPSIRVFDEELYNKKTEKELKALLEQSRILSDCDARDMFHFFKAKKRKSVNDYMQMLGLIKSQGFICTEYDAYIEEMKKSPDEFKTYLKMLKEMSDNTQEKKILTAILKKPVAEKNKR